MTLKEAYIILQLDESATDDEIRRQYRKLSIKYHPDHNPSDERESTAKMQQINAAYDLIVESRKNGKVNVNGTTTAKNTTGNETLQLYIIRIFEELSKHLKINKFKIIHEQSLREKEILENINGLLIN